MSDSTPHAFIASQIEAILFSEGGPVAIGKLRTLLKINEMDIRDGLRALRERLTGGGLTLIETDTEAALVVSDIGRAVISEMHERELGREIGDAGLEVLSVVLYRGASTRTQIDYIRGVGSASTIRSLLGRGLIERASNPADSREYLYRPTTELLAYLGVARVDDLPEYAKITNDLAVFENTRQSPLNHDNPTAESSSTRET
jgi:segregation and condensation protein B